MNKSLLATVFIALAAPTATMAAPTVHGAFAADNTMHEIVLKKVRIKPKSAPEKLDDPSYLKGTNIPKRITAPPSN